MQFSQPNADIFVPDGRPAREALRRVTHLCVGAHQDDIEIMAYGGITDCLDQPGKAFGGVVVTNGAGSPRTGSYAHMTDEQMQGVRREEQREAARLGRYSIQLQLAHPSSHVKTAGHAGVAADLETIFRGCLPEVIYLHNPTDKHDTHVAVFLRCIEALRALPAAQRPARVVGCEVWRDLDWMVDTDKIALDAGRHPELAERLLRVFDSQVSGGKRYDLAAIGRRAANATFHSSHTTDQYRGITWAMDLTPLITVPERPIEVYVEGFILRLRTDVLSRLAKASSRGAKD
jgi:LmbE family N-acetylglucosaminyl deacetylase